MDEPSFVLEAWPELPEDNRPRDLFVDYYVPPELRKKLEHRGWEIKDTRILSKQESIEGLLEGMRVGSIPMRDISQLRPILDLETKIEGMLNAKERRDTKDSKKKAKTIEDLLSTMGTKAPKNRQENFTPKKIKASVRPKTKPTAPNTTNLMKELTNER